MRSLDKIRSEIDKTDVQILSLIKKRLLLVIRVGRIKQENNLKVKDLRREKEVLENIAEKAKSLNISTLFIRKIWKLFFNESYKLEK